MADYKQYILQEQANGTVMISEDVVAAIAEQALNDVDGIVGISMKPGAEIADLINKSWGKGIRIQIADDNSLTIDCNVIVCYGCSVVDAAEAVQHTISAAVENMTGVKVSAVNVNVSGIARK